MPVAGGAVELVVAVVVAVPVVTTAAATDGIALMVVAVYGAVATAEHLGIHNQRIMDDFAY